MQLGKAVLIRQPVLPSEWLEKDQLSPSKRPACLISYEAGLSTGMSPTFSVRSVVCNIGAIFV